MKLGQMRCDLGLYQNEVRHLLKFLIKNKCVCVCVSVIVCMVQWTVLQSISPVNKPSNHFVPLKVKWNQRSLSKGQWQEEHPAVKIMPQINIFLLNHCLSVHLTLFPSLLHWTSIICIKQSQYIFVIKHQELCKIN